MAALLGAAAAQADTSSWTPNYTVDNATLYAGLPALNDGSWQLPASFSHGTGADAITLTGTDYLMKSGGGFNDEFITKGGAIYDQNQLGGGFTNLYYDAGTGHTAVDVLKTPLGDIHLASAPSWAVPTFPTSTAEEAGHNVVVADNATDRIVSALGLSKAGEFSGGLTPDATITPLLTKDSSLVWSAPPSYTDGTGADATTLTGNLYVTSPTDVEFVDKAGDVFDQNTLVSGFLPVVNLYYDPVGGPDQDYLLTIFGNINISSFASWFAPADVADLTAPSPEADLTDAGLYSALDLGLPAA